MEHPQSVDELSHVSRLRIEPRDAQIEGDLRPDLHEYSIHRGPPMPREIERPPGRCNGIPGGRRRPAQGRD